MISCTKCDAPLPRQLRNSQQLVRCTACKSELKADVYPAVYRESQGSRAGETLQEDKEAGCFYHPRKKAVLSCSTCGRFLCQICDVELNGRHLCPSCLESGKTRRKIKNLEDHRTRYDKIALTIAVVPILTVWLTIISAPIALYLTIRYWKAPLGIIPHTRVRFMAAFLISGAQILGWSLLFFGLISS